MFTNVKDRQKKILELLRQKKYISVSQLQKLLFSSEATIRRDLSILAKNSLIKKVPGGALFLEETNSEQPLYYKARENADKKKLIAQIAYGLVSEHQSLFLDASSTVYVLAKQLIKINHLRTLSNSIYTSALLSTNPTIESYCTPGKIAHKLGVVHDYHTIPYIKQYHADIAFLSCRGFDKNFGASDFLEYEAAIKRCYAQQADKVILLIDSTKWDKKFFFQSIPPEKISIVVTDSSIPDDICIEFKNRNILILDEL